MKKLLALLASVAALGIITHVSARSEKSNVGNKLPELTSLVFLDAKPEIKDKPVLLEFWATWCPPCRTSIPHLNELHAKYKDKIVFIGASSEAKDVITKFRESTPMKYSVAIDTDGKLGEGFGIQGIPHAIIADKSGKIVWEGHPMRLNEKILDEHAK
jgi:thiol-disulfide isomerase/thioredoxin